MIVSEEGVKDIDGMNDLKWTIILLFLIEYLNLENENKYSEFVENINSHSRFLPNDKTVDFLVEFGKLVDESVIKVRKGKLLYRGRIVQDDLKKEMLASCVENIFDAKDISELIEGIKNMNDAQANSFFQYVSNEKSMLYLGGFLGKMKEQEFQGYSKSNSTAPPNEYASNGRLNPEKISYLYTAYDVETAIFEVKPLIGQMVSVAKLKSNKTLDILDLTKVFPMEQFDCNDTKQERKSLLQVISEEFAKPNYGDSFKYLPTQYLTNYVKEIKKLDGILFWSSLHKGGKNLVVFDSDTCEVISSEIFCVEDMKIKYVDFVVKHEKTDV